MSDRILFFSASRLSLLLASPTLAAYSNWIQAKQSRYCILTKTILSRPFHKHSDTLEDTEKYLRHLENIRQFKDISKYS